MSAKFPRIRHLPWSPGRSADDLVSADVSSLVGIDLVVTEKLDGGNCALTRPGVFARSHAGPPKHPSFDALKALHARLRDRIPEGHTVFAEWCWAVHSIEYTRGLPSPLFIIAVRDDRTDRWASREQAVQAARDLGAVPVPALWTGRVESQSRLRDMTGSLARAPSLYGPEREGVVVWPAQGCGEDEFESRVLKWVRTGHLRTDDRWGRSPIRRQPTASGN